MQLHEQDFAALASLASEENARMSEDDFVRLLKYLIPAEGEEHRPRDLSIYVEAVGHAQRLIDVYDRQGQLLFTVPPLLSRAPMPVPSKENTPGGDLGEISAIYDARINTEHPRNVNDWFYQALIALDVPPEQATLNLYARMWAHIYKRYNVPLERLFGEKAGLFQELVDAKDDEQVPKGSVKDEFSDDDFEDL
jgi:hypothetical protein